MHAFLFPVGKETLLVSIVPPYNQVELVTKMKRFVTSPTTSVVGFKDFCFLLVAACADRPFRALKRAVICNEFLLHPSRLDPMPEPLQVGLTGVQRSHVKARRF